MNPNNPNEKNNQQTQENPQTPSSPDLYSSLLSSAAVVSSPGSSKSFFGKIKQLGFKGYLLVVVSILFIVVIILSIFLKGHAQPNSPAKTISSTSLSTTKKSNSSSSKSSSKTSTPTSSNGSINIDYVTVDNSTVETPGPIDSGHDFVSNSFQPSNYDYAATANGHYVYIDDANQTTTTDSNLGGNLIYDGQSEYQGSDLLDGSAVISQNGLHYGYAKDNGSNYEIYIDNKLISSNLDDADALTLLQVSNDGKSIVYDDGDSSGSDTIYNNESLVYQDWGLNAAAFSSDLTKYVANLNDINGDVQLIYDGSVITGNDFGDGAGISENGQHYFYLTSPSGGSSSAETLFVDSNQVGTVNDQFGIGINDKGDYYYLDPGIQTFYLGSKSYGLSASNISDADASDLLLTVNSDSTDFVVGNTTTGYWDLNGTSNLSLSGKIFQIELENNTLYVYRWAK